MSIREEFEAAFVARQVDQYGEGYRASAIHMLKRDGEFERLPTPYELHRRELGMYDMTWVELAWWAWQASHDTNAAVIAELKAESERLRADCASLSTFNPDWDRVAAPQDSVREHMAVAAQLKAENEVLRKDADRWQFVRNPVGSGSPFAIWSERTNLFLGKFADEAIDAAMGKGERS